MLCEILSLVSQKLFPLFNSQLCPWVWQLGVHLLLSHISDVHFLLMLGAFTKASGVLHHLAPISCSRSEHDRLTSLTPRPPRHRFDHLELSLSLEHDMLLTSALFLLPRMLLHHCNPLSLWLSFF